MDIQPIQPINFGILKKIKKRSYGTYMEGSYKGYNIEVYDAFKFNQFLIYVSDKCRNFVKSKLIYWENGEKKITKSEGRKI